MTTSPPGFSIDFTLHTDWTTNTLFTTTKDDGSTVIIPVIVGCPDCDGQSILIWNLSWISWVAFRIPGFPKLPWFHFHCFIHCGTGGGGGGGGNSPGKSLFIFWHHHRFMNTHVCIIVDPVAPVVEPGKDEPQDEEPTTTTSTTSSSSSSSCSSSSSSTMSTAEPIPFFIVPNFDATPEVLQAFTAQLKLETNPDTLFVCEAPAANFIAFWYQFLNGTQLAEFKSHPAVSPLEATTDVT